VIWLAVAAAVLVLTVWSWRRTVSPTDFFAAARTAGPLLAGLGGTAAGLSAFVFVGGPGLFAAIGAASLWIILSAPLTGALQCWVVGERIVDLVQRHHCLTVPGLVAARFGEGWPRGIAAAAVAGGGVATLAVQIKGTAIVAEVLLGAPGSIVALLTVAATVLYTTAGGMRAGLLAEAAQAVIMASTAVGLAAMALIHAGGPAAALATVAEARPRLLQPWGEAGPTAGLGLFLLFALGTCAQPHYLQKFLLVRDRRALRAMPAVMTGALLAVLTVWVGVGLGGTALWLGGGLEVNGTDELAPRLLLAILPPSLLAVAVVAVLAAVMSTAASLLNLVAAALSRDLPLALGRMPGRGLGAARGWTVAAGAAAAALALTSDRPVAWLGVVGWGTFTAALLPTVVVGLAWRGASRRGAVIAMVLGCSTQLALELSRTTLNLAACWEPGLSGAAVGTLALVLFSGGERNHDEAMG
jgi:sodium/proline symporter/sodium/pantothenate symporter